ncbi:cupin domain-containing protein [Rosenbergiella nectarea]|uniref:ribosomal protein uL16 3-hydroxylase n=1 Tax=Rosenbergiella nectarea TaxID=988801 RepID=UPI001BD9CBF6|nr:cupin domain-containing protein [Rosenbergiella nectarea]MBT0731258.1 cupin domain-containing protein [Rosenbergiella nectarea subsp. apis]
MSFELAIDWPTFLATAWQKKPVVIRQAFRDFQDPISPDELAGLAMENEVDSRLVSQTAAGWQVAHGPFSDFDHLSESHWSLLVQAVNHWHPAAAELMQPFRALSDWRMDDLMISFSVPDGGVGPHLDQYDVFIIQGAGRRRWRVGNNDVVAQHSPHPDLLQVAPFEAIIDEVLEPGDLVYIPPGFPHEGYSLENSLNYSVGFRAPSGKELLSGFADYVLAQELGSRRYQDPTLRLRDNPASILTEEADSLRAMISGLVDSEEFTPWLGEFLSQSRHELDIAPPQPAYQEDEVRDALEEGTPLHRIGGLKVLQLASYTFINGERFSSTVPGFLNLLATTTEIDAEQLSPFIEENNVLTQLTGLINAGYWHFAGEEEEGDE